MFYIKSFLIGRDLKTQSFNPLWLTSYSGFEVHPYIAGTWFSVGKEEGYWVWNEPGWQTGDSPIFYPPGIIRNRIDKLPPGKIYFQSNQAYSGEIRLGYYLSGSLPDYLLNFALPEYIKATSFNVIRWVELEEGQLEVAIPAGLNISRIKKASIFNFKQNNQIGYINKELGAIVFANALEYGDARLILDYDLEIISVVDQGTYQIASLPSVGIVPISPGSKKYDLSGCSEVIGIAGGGIKESVSTWQQNQLVEVVAFSNSLEDSRVIAQGLMNQITAKGCIHLPPFDSYVYLKVNSEIEIEKKYNNIKGSVRTCKFELLISNLLEG